MRRHLVFFFFLKQYVVHSITIFTFCLTDIQVEDSGAHISELPVGAGRKTGKTPEGESNIPTREFSNFFGELPALSVRKRPEITGKIRKFSGQNTVSTLWCFPDETGPVLVDLGMLCK